MTDAGSLEASKQIANGWSRIKLDPVEALKHFDAAVAADPKSAAARVGRSKARLEAGDAAGALEDAEAASSIEPRLGAAYAARAEAKSVLGRAAAELLADYETAAKLDGGFVEAYKAALVRSGAAAGANAAGGQVAAGGAATDIPRGILKRSPKGWGWLALIVAALAAAGGVIAPLILKRRRSDRDGSLPR
jgi:tetratricopeptide (TPR) repeat protein